MTEVAIYEDERKTTLIEQIIEATPDGVGIEKVELFVRVAWLQPDDMDYAEIAAKLIGQHVRHPDFTYPLLVIGIAFPSVSKVWAVRDDGRRVVPLDHEMLWVGLAVWRCTLVEKG